MKHRLSARALRTSAWCVCSAAGRPRPEAQQAAAAGLSPRLPDCSRNPATLRTRGARWQCLGQPGTFTRTVACAEPVLSWFPRGLRGPYFGASQDRLLGKEGLLSPSLSEAPQSLRSSQCGSDSNPHPGTKKTRAWRPAGCASWSRSHRGAGAGLESQCHTGSAVAGDRDTGGAARCSWASLCATVASWEPALHARGGELPPCPGSEETPPIMSPLVAAAGWGGRLAPPAPPPDSPCPVLFRCWGCRTPPGTVSSSDTHESQVLQLLPGPRGLNGKVRSTTGGHTSKNPGKLTPPGEAQRASRDLTY